MKAGRPKYHSIFYKYVIVKNNNGTISCFDFRKQTQTTKDDEIILYKKDQKQAKYSFTPLLNECQEGKISNDDKDLLNFNCENSKIHNNNHSKTVSNKFQTIDLDFTSEQMKFEIDNNDIFECTNYFYTNNDILSINQQHNDIVNFDIITDELNMDLDHDAFDVNEQEPIEKIDHDLI